MNYKLQFIRKYEDDNRKLYGFFFIDDVYHEESSDYC